MTLLMVDHLNIAFKTPEGVVAAVNDLSFTLEAGETLGIVGETGAGKSQTAFALMGLLAKNSQVSGSIYFADQDLLQLAPTAWNQIRAQQIAMIFQDPMTSLNPYLTIGKQLMELLVRHKGMNTTDAFNESVWMLEAVKIPEARRRMTMYPHEFSGGMRQRVMIAMALLCRPRLLLADEPTTALDVTVQAQIMELLNELKQAFNTSIILITHDLGVVAGSCDKVLVMYAGSTVEYGSTESIFYCPSHPYTLGLLSALPQLDSESRELMTIPGEPPNLLQLPSGCPFQERCSLKDARCQVMPPLRVIESEHLCACYHAKEHLS